VSAEKSMIQQNIKTGHNKGLIDQRAAAIVLQQFLDKQNR
jgi:RNase H-fold protein (predicted Holliday junction resolvase)